MIFSNFTKILNHENLELYGIQLGSLQTRGKMMTQGHVHKIWKKNIYESETIEPVLTASVKQHQLADHFRKRAKVITLWQYVPFMSDIHSLSCCTSASLHDTDEHVSRLDAVTTSWGFSRVAVPGDGDCFFTSVSLSEYLDSVSTLSEHLHSKGVEFQMNTNITNLVLELRRLMVNELLVNRHLYDGLFEDTFEQDN